MHSFHRKTCQDKNPALYIVIFKGISQEWQQHVSVYVFKLYSISCMFGVPKIKIFMFSVNTLSHHPVILFKVSLKFEL